MVQHKLIFYNASGIKKAEVWNMTYLAYAKQLGKAGVLRVGLPADHYVVPLLANNWIIEDHRRDSEAGLDWYVDFRALFKDYNQETNPYSVYELVAPGELEILNSRCVAWKADTADRSKFTSKKPELIAKTLVQYNLTASATSGAGRVFDGTTSGFGVTVEADAGSGVATDWYCTGDNLLDTLYALSQIGGGDYDLIKTAASTWDFRWYHGQRGTDFSATVIFATEYGNMAKPTQSVRRSDEKTIAIVAGQGQAADRDWIFRLGDNYSVAHRMEMFVDARHIDRGDTAALNTHGDSALREYRALTNYGFKILQTPACAYGKHYAIGGVMGDLVKARYYGNEQTQKLDEVIVSYEPGAGESVEVVLKDV